MSSLECWGSITLLTVYICSLQWGSKAFKNMRIIPPGSGIVHQVNLEYLARVVFNHNGFLYPDSLVGTDSHTTMIDGLGVLGWGMARVFHVLLVGCGRVAPLASEPHVVSWTPYSVMFRITKLQKNHQF